jgi:hypothetical protein
MKKIFVLGLVAIMLAAAMVLVVSCDAGGGCPGNGKCETASDYTGTCFGKYFDADGDFKNASDAQAAVKAAQDCMGTTGQNTKCGC